MLSSCNLNRKSNNALPVELIQAENIMYENPDSALQILQGMVIPLDKEAHATWALLLTQAKYKCDIAQSDSLVNVAYDYFIKGDDAQKKALSLYIKGGLLNEINQQDKALSYYLKAAEECGYSDDYRLSYLINSHISRMYAERKLYDYSLKYGVKAKENALLAKDSLYLIDSYMVLARVYTTSLQYHIAIESYDNAIDIGKKSKKDKKVASALMEKINVLIKMKKYTEALEVSKKFNRRFIGASGCFTLGHLYYKLDQPDSAYFYLNKAIMSDNIYTQQSAYQVLFYLSKRTQDYKRNTEYSTRLWLINDSINKMERNEALIEMQEKYDQQKVINEKNKAERRGLIVLCISIGLIAIVVVYYQWRMLIQNKELEEKRKQLNLFVNQLSENKQIIAKNTERINELVKNKEDSIENQKEQQDSIERMKQQNKSLNDVNNTLLQQIEEYTAIMDEKSKELKDLHALSEMNLYLHKRELFLCAELLKKDEFVNKLKKHPKALDAVQWEETIGKTNTIYDNYTIRLRNQVPDLTENDIRICCLIKLSFSNVEIASILGISSASVSRQKLRLKERIVQKLGPLDNNLTLDIWLKEY